MTPQRTSGRRTPGPARRIGAAGLVLALLASLAVPLAADPEGVPGTPRGALVPIRGTIDDIMRDSLERRVQAARDAGANTIIFELDTPGGLVTAALDICRFIKNLPDSVRTVAWVHPQAYSAGAMIAVACDEIWMSPASAIGDAAPIMVVPLGGAAELGETERAKAESPIIQEFRDSAVRNGYDVLLSRAMVTLGTEVWWLEHVTTGARRFVEGAEKKQRIDDVDAEQREWKLVESYTLKLGGAERTYPVQQPIDRENELLTMSQADAVGFGFARGIVADLGELSEQLELKLPPPLYESTGWERFAAWLNSPLVRGVLFVIVLIGAYLEFQHPGLILPGVTALVALAVFLGAPYAAGLATIWTFVAVGLGLVLLAIEIFLIPGFGFTGLLGLALILLAVIASFVPAEPGAPPFALPTLQGTWTALRTGLQVTAGSIVTSVIGILLLAQFLPRSRLARGIVLANPQGATYTVHVEPPAVAAVGDIGVVTGALRPGGQARFGHEIVDVCSQGEYLETGRRVQVVRREGMNVFVRPLPEEGAGSA